MAASSHLLVRYPAHSLSKIGGFCGGDCVVSLSRIALSVTQSDNTPIASWQYNTICSFQYRSSLFCFVSGQRGPYGEKTYFFKVTFSVMSSLLSVLSELLNMQIEYIADSEGESNGCNTMEVAARVPHSKKPVQSSEASSCYKVAKSTFYTDLPSETRKMDNAPSSSRVHHLASSFSVPSLSIPMLKENNMCKAPERHFASTVTPQNLSTSLLVAKPSKPHQSLHMCKSEGDSDTDSSHYIELTSFSAPTRRKKMPCNNEYLQLKPTLKPQLVHQTTTLFPSMFINYKSDPGKECIDHVGGDEEGERGARDDAIRVHTTVANRVRHMSLDETHNDRSMECCLPLPFSTPKLTLYESTDDDCIERQDEDIVKQSSHQPHYENPVASSIDIANESLVLSEESTTDDSDMHYLENWALPCNRYFSKRRLLDERAAVGVVHHVIRPCSSAEYSNVCMHVRLSTENGLQ